MSGERVGRAIRALRHRRDWTQAELGRRARCSASVISRLEQGRLRACSVTTLERVLHALDARLVMSVLWRGGELDRLLDADHALLGERWALLRPKRWVARSEVTYNEYGDRGSIDELAFDPAFGVLLVTELKTGIYETWRTIAKLDEKVRVAVRVARRFGWSVRRVVPALVVAETRTNRRRVEAHGGSAGWTAAGAPRGHGCGILTDPRLAACCCSFRCQMCVGRTVGEPDGSAYARRGLR